jgi:Flp pilus assembly protein TadD
MRTLLIASCLAAAAPLPIAAQTPLQAVDLARTARSAGRFQEAERLLRIALKSEPGNYLALYNMGLVYEAYAIRAEPGDPRVRHYRTAAQWLERAFASPQRVHAGPHAYTIYNSLGAMYLGAQDISNAARYLEAGLRHEAQLKPDSRGKLYGNLGYLYALRGDLRRARTFFEKGAKLGSSYSAQNLARLGNAGRR